MNARSYIVIDACIAGAWIFPEEFTAQALPLLNAIERFDVYPIVPDRFYIETLRVCQKKIMTATTQSLSPESAWRRFQLIEDLPILPVNVTSYAHIWRTAQEARLTVHDALYVVLAQEWNAPLWTLDAGLASTPPSVYPEVFDLRTMIFPY